MQYTTVRASELLPSRLFYQDFKDTFVCNTQLYFEPYYCICVVLSGFQRYFCMQYTTVRLCSHLQHGCFIRISKILLYAIHNKCKIRLLPLKVVLSGFQRYFCMQYTTDIEEWCYRHQLFYQDFKDTFVCNTQLVDEPRESGSRCFIRMSMNNLKDIHNKE